jgi:hypothetical protein
MEIAARRMSGEMNTSLGNGFSNLMLFLFACAENGIHADGFVEGDDGIFWVSDDSRAPTTQQMEDYGWDIKIGSSIMSHASFCGNIFDIDDEIIVTDPRKALITFGWTNKRYANCSRDTAISLLRAKALSMAHQYNGCPMLSAFSRRIISITNNHRRISKRILGAFDPYHQEQILHAISSPLPPPLQPTPATRTLFEMLYGIPADLQAAFEDDCCKIELDCELETFLTFKTEWYETSAHYTGPQLETNLFFHDGFVITYLRSVDPTLALVC